MKYTLAEAIALTDGGIRFEAAADHPGLFRKVDVRENPKAAYDAMPDWMKDLPGLRAALARDEAAEEGGDDPTKAILEYLRQNMAPAALDGLLKRMGDSGLMMTKIAKDEPPPFSGRPRPNDPNDSSTTSIMPEIKGKVGGLDGERQALAGDRQLAYDASTRAMSAKDRSAFHSRYPDAHLIRTLPGKGF
jgi:hypothetical protein